MPACLLIDISNSFTKVSRTDGDSLEEPVRIPTGELSATALQEFFSLPGLIGMVFSSVVPGKTVLLKNQTSLPFFEVRGDSDLGIGIDYPTPMEIGPDRLANTVACSTLFGAPAIAVDFGTAVTFDVLSKENAYCGGIIAPGLNAMTGYLHEKTALLPEVQLEEPASILGKSTKAAMLAGTVFGYRGLIREILSRLKQEVFGDAPVPVIATGGDAVLIGGGLPIFDHIDPLLTLHGLRILALRHFFQKFSG